VLVRRVRGSASKLICYVRPELGERRRYGSVRVEEELGALVFYCRETSLAIAMLPRAQPSAGRMPPEGTSQVLADALDGRLDGSAAGHGAVDGALATAVEGEAVLFAAFGETPEVALAELAAATAAGADELLRQRIAYDAERLATTEPPLPVAADIDALYRRSLLVFDLVADRSTGGVIAAPELDADFALSGGYGYVWARDQAYAALAFLACGRDDLARSALRWLLRAQSPEGLWLQRHWTDGRLGPCWCTHQLDETGTALLACEAAFAELGDEELDRKLWPCVRRAADFLLDFREASGLPRATFDVWEEREGVHAYTAAATAGGLRAAARAAQRHDPARAGRYAEAAEVMRGAIDAELWSEEAGRFARALGDTTVDISLLGLGWPFAAVPPGGERLRATAATIERELELPGGGLLRYAGDTYVGGNAWVLADLWLALWHRQAGDEDAYRRRLAAAVAAQTELGLLPEQVGPDGRPAWVLPLTWSHALLVLAARPELRVLHDLA
jgi:glucoamylase